MILLTLAFLREHLVPSRNKLDRIDQFLLWVIKISLLVLFLTLPQVVLSEEEPPMRATDPFFFACGKGGLGLVKSLLEEHPDWLNARTDSGEACLHLTGIEGYAELTKYLLLKGADPNIRSTFEQGLRMHPLSWNVYGGHVDNVKILLEHGADVNLDFDGMEASNAPVTALDVVMELVKNEEGDERFVKLEKLLRENGGKTMAELTEGGTESKTDEL
jgi:ankyrin repeat protein